MEKLKYLIPIIFFSISGCVIRPAPDDSPTPQGGIPSSTHRYELLFQSTDGEPIQEAEVLLEPEVVERPPIASIKCVTNSVGICKIDFKVLAAPRLFATYRSILKYRATKAGFYTEIGAISSDAGSANARNKGLISKATVTLYKPSDFLSENFLNSASDQQLRMQALKFISLIRYQSLMVNADLVLKSIGTSSFKGKKYFQLKINTTTVFNSLKLNRYAIGNNLFDYSIRKILNPLNDNISDEKSFYGYDITIYGYSKDFLLESNTSDKVAYRFLIPQNIVKQYKDKDISGQQLLDASVILMDDERIDLKLQ